MTITLPPEQAAALREIAAEHTRGKVSPAVALLVSHFPGCPIAQQEAAPGWGVTKSSAGGSEKTS